MTGNKPIGKLTRYVIDIVPAAPASGYHFYLDANTYLHAENLRIVGESLRSAAEKLDMIQEMIEKNMFTFDRPIELYIDL